MKKRSQVSYLRGTDGGSLFFEAIESPMNRNHHLPSE